MLRHQPRPSGVVVLSGGESNGSGCGSDITEPRSPRSPESGCDDSGGARMPPWAGEAAPRRLAAQPVPLRRPPQPPSHRRITEFFSHKMKPQPALKREASTITNGDTKRKCLPKNGVTDELEKYISYLSQTLNPKVLYDVGKKTDAAQKINVPNGVTDNTKAADLNKTTPTPHVNGMFNFSWPKDNKDKTHTALNGFVEVRPGTEPLAKDKTLKGLNGVVDAKNQSTTQKAHKGKVPIPASTELSRYIIKPASQNSKKLAPTKVDSAKTIGVVSSTTKLDSKMNGVTRGSNNLSLTSKSCKMETKKDVPKKPTSPAKRTNRKSSACIANSKNLTWSKANNLKQQVQLQQQSCANTSSSHSSPVKTGSIDANATPKMTFTNGVRLPMTVNGSLGNLNTSRTNFQNCHPLNISQPCNGTVTSTHLPSFVAVPQNVMLTTLRIPQNGIPAQTLNHQNNMNTFNGSNVSSPTKLNGQFVFPLVQNLNGTVVQIPNLMAKMPNFVLPQATQLTTHRQDHLQNQQATPFLINGTLLKLANTMTSTYQVPNINKSIPTTSQCQPVLNKNVTGIPNVGMNVQPKPNFSVNLSHSVLMPQPGFIMTSVPNINVKETWSYTSTHPIPIPTSCSNPIGHHPPPLMNNFTTPTLHSSSIPIAPVKPPDNPIQGTDPPSSTVKEPEISEAKISAKCDIPWLSKTVNNNIVSFDSKLPFRPFADVGMSDKLSHAEKVDSELSKEAKQRKDNTNGDIRKIEEVARREETLFTQITMLKDVSSDVQNSIIESNCCSPPTESSESGIGTDKSIDSPTDSHTSKECDDDSSLSVSVCSSIDAPCQKSPILKQPKTLRFPPKQQTKSEKRKSGSSSTSSITVCQWENCKSEFDSDTDLLEHLQRIHVESQAGKENYVCMWSQCKVRGKPSCSRLWLERHALSHGGNKPFKCIVDNCDKRFSTQILLERHVNNHFNESSSSSNGSKKSVDSAAKLIRRNGKKLRYRRQPWSARMFDFFDAGTMEGLRWRLSRAARWRLGGACPLREPAGRHTLALHAACTATRRNDDTGVTEALLTYYPPNVVEDEWVAEKDVTTIKRVEISELPTASKVLLYEQFCASYRKTASEKKPEKNTVKSSPTPRLLPNRHCTSSRLLNNLLSKKREARNDCSATNVPIIYKEEEKEKTEVSGAKKRKMGRRHGGNCFWPCGR